MGSSFGIVLYSGDESTANGAFEAAFARVAELDRICSDYDSTSEVSQLSARAPTQAPVQVSTDLFRILTASQELSEKSGGALDVTIGPLTKLWRRARLQKVPPGHERIQQELKSVGYRAMVLDPRGKTVELRSPGMRIDLGSIAKGYAADEALAALRQRGIHRALVNASGNIAVAEPPPGENAWRIEIAAIDNDSSEPAPRILRLCRAGIATAGDKFQFLEYEGKRYSHILDPRTGYGITQPITVTVVGPTAMIADGLDTTVAILGVERGLKLVEETPGAAARITVIENGKTTVHESSRLAAFLIP